MARRKDSLPPGSKRTSLYFTPEQLEVGKALAKKLNVGFTHLVREGLDLIIEKKVDELRRRKSQRRQGAAR